MIEKKFIGPNVEDTTNRSETALWNKYGDLGTIKMQSDQPDQTDQALGVFTDSPTEAQLCHFNDVMSIMIRLTLRAFSASLLPAFKKTQLVNDEDPSGVIGTILSGHTNPESNDRADKIMGDAIDNWY